MVIKNLFSRVWLHGQYRVFHYALRFCRMTDDEVMAAVNHEQGLRAWCSERSYYLAALRGECRRRGLMQNIEPRGLTP